MYLTYQYRIKDSSCRHHLRRMASSVNTVWNYCNELQITATRRWKLGMVENGWLHKFEMMKIGLASSGKDLGLPQQVVNAVAAEYCSRRDARVPRVPRLNWRSAKRSLGWIPITSQSIKVDGDTARIGSLTVRFWKHRELPGAVKGGSISEDAQGRWYLNLQVAVDESSAQGTAEIGIDLGVKTKIATSDGRVLHRESLTKRYEEMLAKAQRAKKKRLVSKINAKIKHKRKDWNHKQSFRLVSSAKLIAVGNVSAKDLVAKSESTAITKSLLDAGWYQVKSMLAYKSKKLGVDFVEVDESYSTQTCSHCGSKTGPKGKAGLSVREWVCSTCGTKHLRDVNGAVNILRVGRHALSKRSCGSEQATTETQPIRKQRRAGGKRSK